MAENLKNEANRSPKVSMTTNRQKVLLQPKQMVFRVFNLIYMKGSPFVK